MTTSWSNVRGILYEGMGRLFEVSDAGIRSSKGVGEGIDEDVELRIELNRPLKSLCRTYLPASKRKERGYHARCKGIVTGTTRSF